MASVLSALVWFCFQIVCYAGTANMELDAQINQSSIAHNLERSEKYGALRGSTQRHGLTEWINWLLVFLEEWLEFIFCVGSGPPSRGPIELRAGA